VTERVTGALSSPNVHTPSTEDNSPLFSKPGVIHYVIFQRTHKSAYWKDQKKLDIIYMVHCGELSAEYLDNLDDVDVHYENYQALCPHGTS